MSAHTPGQWRLPFHDAETLIRIIGDDGTVVAAVGDSWHELTDQQRADASRIVACVNACEGIDSELLEPRMLGNQIAAKMAVIEERDALRAERDALRAALARIIFEAGESGRNVYRDIARAALAQGGEK